jgi:hypothetical protein
MLMRKIGQGRPETEAEIGGWSEVLVLEALSRYVPPECLTEALAGTFCGKIRIRKLPPRAVLWLVIAMGLWGDLDVPAIWRQVAGTLRTLWQVAAGRRPPGKSALSRARKRVGPRPMRRLFVRTAESQATPQTRGAFYRGMRLMLIDGQKLLVPDTPANATAFGRPSTRRYGKEVLGGYPQITTLRLMEAGTHITVEAVLKPAHAAEYPQAAGLLKKAAPGDLVLWDRGYYGYSLLQEARAQGKHVLGRVPSYVILEKVRTLADGSYLADIYPTARDKRRRSRALRVRVLEYTLDDPARPGHGERHRLVTTLLEAERYPARELIALYHARWEIEIANDEIVTHQLARPVELRSRTPCGVVQEFYGIVLAHNAVRALMHEAARRVDIDPRTLSFIHAVRVIRETVPLLRAAATAQLPRLYDAMLDHLACGRLPPRDGRIHPRVVKTKMSNYQKKRPEHYHLPQPRRSFLEAIVVLK